jgi:transcriptional regulator with XRE-family HTH domain
MSELNAFLKSRRARMSPQDVGIDEPAGNRRVPGLRREELAALAGVSVDYYVRLEQGRSPQVSDQVLEAVARALELSPAETLHLKALARPTDAAPRPPQPVRDALRRILDAHVDSPAFILGRGTEVLAWNVLGDAVFGFSALQPAFRNSARFMFLHPDAASFYPDWSDVAAEIVAWLHSDTARRPNDPDLTELIGQLSIASHEFRALWARHDVHDRSSGSKRVRHPEVGLLELHYETLTIPNEPDLVMSIFLPDLASTTTRERLTILSSWKADHS